MKYGKNTAWLKGIKIGQEPERLTDIQVVRGSTLFERISWHIQNIENKARKSIVESMQSGGRINEKDVAIYNLIPVEDVDLVLDAIHEDYSSRNLEGVFWRNPGGEWYDLIVRYPGTNEVLVKD